MNNEVENQLTDFQIQCERRLIQALSETGLSISNRSLEGIKEKYITGDISGADITFWIYEDGADYKCPNAHPVFEKPDYDSLDDLGKAFVKSIINSIK